MKLFSFLYLFCNIFFDNLNAFELQHLGQLDGLANLLQVIKAKSLSNFNFLERRKPSTISIHYQYEKGAVAPVRREKNFVSI